MVIFPEKFPVCREFGQRPVRIPLRCQPKSASRIRCLSKLADFHSERAVVSLFFSTSASLHQAREYGAHAILTCTATKENIDLVGCPRRRANIGGLLRVRS